MINQLPLWCRGCGSTYEAFDDDGKCTGCETHNVMMRHQFAVLVPVDGYEINEARADFQRYIDHLISQGVLPAGTVVW